MLDILGRVKSKPECLDALVHKRLNFPYDIISYHGFTKFVKKSMYAVWLKSSFILIDAYSSMTLSNGLLNTELFTN